ncbi:MULTISPECIES: hypothetical protein [unclassified Moorena]|nr:MULTISPECIES: hypothetical protein [unclassified Moorena]
MPQIPGSLSIPNLLGRRPRYANVEVGEFREFLLKNPTTKMRGI